MVGLSFKTIPLNLRGRTEQGLLDRGMLDRGISGFEGAYTGVVEQDGEPRFLKINPYRDGWLKERNALGMLDGETAVPRMYDFFTCQGYGCLVLEVREGEELDEIRPSENSLEILEDLGSIIHRIRSKGVVHTDLWGNVIFDEKLTVLDFDDVLFVKEGNPDFVEALWFSVYCFPSPGTEHRGVLFPDGEYFDLYEALRTVVFSEFSELRESRNPLSIYNRTLRRARPQFNALLELYTEIVGGGV